ncbi:MAG: nucleotide exchange factor GrpE [Candidatus Diapherotrites archaeon]
MAEKAKDVEEKAAGKAAEAGKSAKPAEKNASPPKAAKPQDAEKNGRGEKAAHLEREKKELVETLQRLQAEFENYKKRAEREMVNIIGYGNAATVARFLPLADTMDSAMKNSGAEEKKAIEPIRNQFMRVLKGFGTEEMHALGKKFDPALHDCIAHACEKENGDAIVIEEIQKGYLINGKVLRHAKVKVNKRE